MIAKLPSLTALLVASVRGLPRDRHSAPVDPLAPQMLPRPLGVLLTLLKERAEKSPSVAQLLPVLSVGLVDHLALRTLAIDAACEAAVEAGAAQLVVLGAGYDTRAYRLPCLAGLRVFEVDHPATSAEKARRAAPLRPIASEVVRVPLDFERASLEEELARAGHDSQRPTLWLWEGVTMYLTEAAIDATLITIAKRSAPDSVLVMSYGPLDFAPTLFSAAVRVIGEPVRHLMSPSAVQEKLLRFGFATAEDQGPAEWRQRFGDGGLLVAKERVVIAAKPKTPAKPGASEPQ